ncbi:hypothetical protein [Methylopila sp. M107]|uniref:hypothetical protein n=1 Tax=Methylopila sp. M107 TaxID=1101190 RepID=UPI001FDA96B5|nr:hypothetical protein [Methylopila sp. M107]
MTVANAIPYEPSLEHPEDNEDQVRRELIETLRSISETTFANSGHALRSVHAKSHALLVVE